MRPSNSRVTPKATPIAPPPVRLATVRFPPRLWRKGAAILMPVLATALFGCGKDIEKIRDQQDKRIKEDGLPVVLAEYESAYAAAPYSPEAAYLYARILEDPRKKADILADLLSNHPKFGWGHVLAASGLRDIGDYQARLVELQKAATIQPSSKTIQKLLAEAKYELLSVQADYQSAVAKRLSNKMDGVYTVATWSRSMTELKQYFTSPPALGRSIEVLATVDADDSEHNASVRLYIQNGSGKTIGC
jgi:hypothetical protein